MRRDSLEEDRMSTITVDDLMKEIKKAAVEKQSDLLYKVKLMGAKQERDELVRTFVAYEAIICILFTDCTATPAPRLSPTWNPPYSWLALVKGLVDVDTKGEILSKLKQMDLDLTVAFMEARETGKRDLVLLNGGPTDSLQSLQLQVTEVQPGRPLHQGLQEDG